MPSFLTTNKKLTCDLRNTELQQSKHTICVTWLLSDFVKHVDLFL